MPIMDQNAAAAMLAKFLAPGGGNVTATDGMDAGAQDMLASQQFSSDLQGENDARLMNDPTNPILQERARQYADREAKNPYSETSSLARLSKAQESTDIMNRFLTNQPMRDRQATDAGTMAQDTAYGHSLGDHMGDYGAEISPAGNQALNARGARDVAVAAAKAKGAGAATNNQSGTLVLPPGVDAGVGHRTDSGANLIQTPKAQQIFAANNMDAGSQQIVGMILDYRLGAPAGAALARSGDMKKYLGAAAMIDPNFDATTYDAGNALRKDLTTGKSADLMQSLNSLGSHLGTLDEKRTALNNSDTLSGAINPLVNWWQSFNGEDKATNYAKAQSIVDSEAAKLLSGTGATSDEATRNQQAGVTSNSSFKQQQGHADTTRELLSGRQTALRQKIAAFPRLLPLYEQLMTEENAAQTNRGADPGLTPSGQAAAASNAAGHPVVGQHGTVNGRDAVWDGSNWVAR